jgi:DNA-binding NarL/FixJ family response regulator
MDLNNVMEWTFNAETGEVIETELSESTLAEYASLTNSVNAEALAKTQARESALAKLAALGLTQQEIEAL